MKCWPHSNGLSADMGPRISAWKMSCSRCRHIPRRTRNRLSALTSHRECVVRLQPIMPCAIQTSIGSSFHADILPLRKEHRDSRQQWLSSRGSPHPLRAIPRPFLVVTCTGVLKIVCCERCWRAGSTTGDANELRLNRIGRFTPTSVRVGQ